MLNLYKKLVPLSIRRFVRAMLYLIRFFPQHISCGINLLFRKIRYGGEGFKYNLATMAIIKNEAPYLKEWIEYHQLAGFEKFILYDNGSEDTTKEILQPYIDSGIVDYTYYPGYKMQVSANNHAIRKWKNKIKYIAMMDVDEFIVPVQSGNVFHVIKDIEYKMKLKKKLFVGLVIKWVNYGHNGHYFKPDGLVIENYKKTDGISLCHKTIINPRMVIRYQVHDGIYVLNRFGVDENSNEVNTFVKPENATINKIRINHYWTKSYEEFKIKWAKGDAVYGKRRMNMPEYNPNYLSSHEDFIIGKYINRLKQRL